MAAEPRLGLSRAPAARRRRASCAESRREGSTVYELTDAGRKHLEENRERFGTPWEDAGAGTPDDVRDLMRLVMDVGMATRQVVQAGTESQRGEARELLESTRRGLYRILAGDET